MTREEEIKQAIENNLDVSFFTPQDGELLKEVFYLGAKWADKNPQSPLDKRQGGFAVQSRGVNGKCV